MNCIDVVIIVILAVAGFFGLRTGVIKAILSLAGIIIGVILAGQYYAPLSEQLTFIPIAAGAKIAAFAIILVGTMAVAAIIARLLKWAASAVMLGWVNHLGGALFGLVMGAFFASAIMALLAKFLGIERIISESILAGMLLDRFPMILTLLPGEFDAVRSFFQ